MVKIALGAVDKDGSFNIQSDITIKTNSSDSSNGNLFLLSA